MELSDYVVDMFQTFFYKAFEIMLPAVLASIAAVILVAVVMAIMQIQEQTLTFLPKVMLFMLVLGFMAPAAFTELVTLIENHVVEAFELI